jgi:hypothetical protein
MSSVVVRYRSRGSSDPWREIKLSLNAGETAAERISRFEDENYGAIELASTDAPVRLVHHKER